MFAAAVMVYWLEMPLFALFLAALGILIIINFFTKKLIIDSTGRPLRKAYHLCSGKTYSLKILPILKLFTTPVYGFITTNVIPSIHLKWKDKNKKLTIGQSVTL